MEAEKSVIGCMMMDEEFAKVAVDALVPEMFFDPTTGRIFEAALELYWDGRPLDSVTLTQKLPNDIDTLVNLAEYVPTTRHGTEYLRIVRDDWRRKTILDATAEIMMESQSRTAEESTEILRKLVEEQDLLTRAQTDEGVSLAQAVREFMVWMKSRKYDGAIQCGYRGMDSAMGGFLKGSVAVVSSRSGGGKTDFAVNLSVRIAKNGYKVQYFTMEMPVIQLMQRVASQVVRIDGTKIRDRDLSHQEFDDIETILKVLEKNSRINFIEEPHISLKRVRHNIDLFKPDIVFIDHIGLMERPMQKDSYRALGMVSNGLKQLALEKKIAIVELAQQNRQVDGRKDKKAQLSDLRESGDLEQDADYVLFIEPEQDLSESDRLLIGDAWADSTIRLKKNRHGRPGTFRFHWQPQYHTFTEVARYN